ncbi:MAG: acyltransferase family protein [Candidatus Amulumruptor caecigallinarius]|nr:acyltransferase family protein [Candidatus Amulumruptor caecigallinarius]MCM1396284.1 acyltransferase family protein [Candidatus Amulumruptor caecigallinarius]MCM1454278.1 acyltransferase family protein [bacterium]
MTKAITKHRIEFIDLAKGICILLIICGHIGVNIPIPGFGVYMLPLYYLISGMFYKESDRTILFTKDKINRLLIPFLFFYISAYLFFYLCNYAIPGLIQAGATGIMDIFTQRQYFNGPIWFVLSLFWCTLIFHLISLVVKHELFRAIIVVAIGSLGAYLGVNNLFVPCMLDTSLTALPFFYVGTLLKKSSILKPNKYDKYNLPIAIVLYTILYLTLIYAGDIHVGFRDNRIIGNYYIILLVTLCGVMSVLLLCKSIKTIPFLVFYGRFSMIPLATHHLVYRPLFVLIPDYVSHKDYVITILTIAITAILIPICNKFIPYFVGKKNLLK